MENKRLKAKLRKKKQLIVFQIKDWTEVLMEKQKINKLNSKITFICL